MEDVSTLAESKAQVWWYTDKGRAIGRCMSVESFVGERDHFKLNSKVNGHLVL